MTTHEAGRVRTVAVAVALFAAWIGGGACAKKEAAPGADASRDATAAVATAIPAPPPPDTLEACFHYDGSEYRCPAEGALQAAKSATFLASGTEVLAGSITLKANGKEYVMTVPPGKKLDAIFLTPRGLKLLEDHYERGKGQNAAYQRRADSVRAFIASFHEP